MGPKVGDLVVLIYAWEKKSPYLELRDTRRKTYYSMPRQVFDPNDVALLLEVEDTDARIVTAQGNHGWIPIEYLMTVSSFERRASIS